MTTITTATTTSNNNANDDMIRVTRESLVSLYEQRKALEEEAETITNELTNPTGEDLTGPPMGIDTPLVDGDGYPRSDIDVYRARTLRGRLSQLRTDHQQLMKHEMEPLLQQLALLSRSNTTTTTTTTKNEKEAEEKELAARKALKPKPKFDPKTGKWVVQNWDGSIAGS